MDILREPYVQCLIAQGITQNVSGGKDVSTAIIHTQCPEWYFRVRNPLDPVS